MRISLIVAMAENRVIGKEGGIPWRLPSDMKRFKATTMGHPIIIGRKTFESFKQALPGRVNIIVTRNADYRADGAVVVQDIDAALRRATDEPGDEVFIGGGTQIYELALPRADRIYLTEVHAGIDGDTVFPEITADEWYEISREFVPKEGKASHDCSFVLLERAAADS